jgi:polyisoprenoid-binding protein YceI
MPRFPAEKEEFCMIKFASFIVFCLMLASPGTLSQTAPKIYTIDTSKSSFWVFVGKAGLFSALAHDHEIGIKTFNGKVIVDDIAKAAGSIEMEVESSSLAVLDKNVSDADRAKIRDSMHNEVLESTKYKKISFKSAGMSDVKSAGNNAYTFTLNGDLTLHGVTKRIAVPVSLTITPQQLRASGKYVLRQTDFGIKPYSAGGGTVKVKNDVTVNFDIVAR